jgi:amidase
MNDLHFQGLSWISEQIKRRTISPVEVTRHLLERVSEYDRTLSSYVTITADRALQQASRAEQEIARGFSRGPLHGVPIAAKDLLFTKDIVTTAGTSLFKDHVPSFNATVIDRLEQAGVVLLGKLKTTEGALFSYHKRVIPPRNPWNEQYSPGVSSGGSAVATAAGLCFGSLGTDTGGSIRLPSACCGLTGLKPTWGRVSRHGLFPLADSLDHIGPIARSASDAATILAAIAGADRNDPTALDADVPDYLARMRQNIRSVRIGVDHTFNTSDVSEEVAAALTQAENGFAERGAKICRVTIPKTEKVIPAFLTLCSVEGAFAHKDTYPLHAAEYGSELSALIEEGRKTTALQVEESLQERRRFSGLMFSLFKEVDLLLTPTISVTVPRLDSIDFEQMTIENSIDGGNTIAPLYSTLLRFTAPFNFSGNPAISFPAGFSSSGLPIGLQLVGRHLSEDLVCRAVHAFQQETDWHNHHPKIAV